MNKLYNLLILLILLILPFVSSTVFLESVGLTSTSPPYLYDLVNTIYFNESKMNATIDARITSGNAKTGSGYLYNDTTYMYLNESLLNNTIDARSGAVGGSGKKGNPPYLYNDSTVMYFNESVLNDTIDARNSASTGNPFDQELNTTSNVTFNEGIVTGNLSIYEIGKNPSFLIYGYLDAKEFLSYLEVIVDDTDDYAHIRKQDDYIKGLKIDMDTIAAGDVNASNIICDKNGCIGYNDTDTNRSNGDIINVINGTRLHLNTSFIELDNLTITQPKAGQIQFNPSGTVNNYPLKIDFGEDWEWGTSLFMSSGGTIRFGTAVMVGDDQNFYFGDNSGASIRVDTSGGSNLKVLRLQTHTAGGQNQAGYIFVQTGSNDRKPTHNVTDPHLRVWANGTGLGDYIEFYHNRNNSFISTGNGNITLNASESVNILQDLKGNGDINATNRICDVNGCIGTGSDTNESVALGVLKGLVQYINETQQADNTTQASLISTLRVDNTTQATIISTLTALQSADNSSQGAEISTLRVDNITQAGLISTLRADNTTQAALIDAFVDTNRSNQDIIDTVNNSYLNGTFFSNVNAKKWGSVVLNSAGCITPGTVPVCTGIDTAQFQAQSNLDWNDVLTAGAKTSGKNPIISYGDILKFGTGQAEAYYNASIEAHPYGILNLTAEEGIELQGDVRIKNGYYQVPNGGTAFYADGFNARLGFNEESNGYFEFFSATNVASLYIGAVTATEGEIITHTEGRMALGDDNSLNDVVDGGLNLTTIYYDNVVPKSPHFFSPDPEVEFTRFCMKDKDGTWGMLYFDKGIMKYSHDDTRCNEKNDVIEKHDSDWKGYQKDKTVCLETGKKNQYKYSSYESWLNGNKTCEIHLDWANWHCIEDYGKLYYYDKNAQGCKLDLRLNCTQYYWNFWDSKDKTCKVNPYYECRYNQPKNENNSFNYNTMTCDLDYKKECLNRGYGWEWEYDTCTYSPDKVNSDHKAECESRGSGWIWYNNECISLGNY